MGLDVHEERLCMQKTVRVSDEILENSDHFWNDYVEFQILKSHRWR